MAISHLISLHLKKTCLLCILSPVYGSATCSEHSQTTSMPTIDSVSPWHLQRITCPKSYFIEPKALCMCWATQPLWGWDGGTDLQAGHTAPDSQPRWTAIKKGWTCTSLLTNPLLSLLNSYTWWLHISLDWNCVKMSVRCCIMVRMWRLDTESTSRYGDWRRGGRFFPRWCTQ